MATASKLYYDPARQSAFSNLWNLRSAAAGTWNKKLEYAVVKACRLYQGIVRETGCLYASRHVWKSFTLNPYSWTNVMGAGECDLMDVQAYAKYNGNHRYILFVIDVFSIFLHLIPMKRKSGPPSPWRFGPYLTMTRNIYNVTYGYELIRARNFEINIFRTC